MTWPRMSYIKQRYPLYVHVDATTTVKGN